MIIVQIGTNTAAWEGNGQINFDSCLKFVNENADQIEMVHLIEPLIDCFPKIEKSYDFFDRKKIYNIAISNEEINELEIYFPRNNKTSGHSSYNKNHLSVLSHSDIDSIKVPCFTLEKFLIDNNITICDRLYIDTEGLDCLILLNYDYNKYKTNYIEFEVAHSDGPFVKSTNSEKCISRLISDGFEIIPSTDDPLNLIAKR